jgi:hypothetical protein
MGPVLDAHPTRDLRSEGATQLLTGEIAGFLIKRLFSLPSSATHLRIHAVYVFQTSFPASMMFVTQQGALHFTKKP